MTTPNPFEGQWSYRSFTNDPNLATPPNALLFGSGTLSIKMAAPELLAGTIGGEGWSLTLEGSRSYGNPMEARFQGRGTVDGHPWVYDYVAYLVPAWPNGVNQVPALVGSVVRTIPHPGSDGKMHPAGVVASFYAVRVKGG